MREHGRGALGSEIRVACETEEQEALCTAYGFVTKEEAETLRAKWRDARYDCVNEAIDLDRKHGIPATSMLIMSATVGEFRAKVEAHRLERRAHRLAGYDQQGART